MADLWDVGKKAGVAGVILMSLPVLIPCVVVLTFAGALLAVPVGSAAVGFYACKKLAIFRRSLEYYSREKRPRSGEEHLLESREKRQRSDEELETATRGRAEQEVSREKNQADESPEAITEGAEEAPEKGAPGRVSDDFIVVEKPSSETRAPEQEDEQCKTAQDYFQCVEAEYAESEQLNQQGETSGARGDGKDSPPRKPMSESFVEVGAPIDQAGGKSDEKNEGAVGLGVILEDSKKNQEQGLGKKGETKEPDHHANGSVVTKEEPPQDHSRKSSVDEYVSMAEDFPSSDESVVSSRNSSSKPGSTDKEKRARLRKEIALVKKVVGCKDATGGTLSDQVERLYGFLGVELPSSYHQTSDYEKLLEAMNVLKAVVGVK